MSSTRARALSGCLLALATLLVGLAPLDAASARGGVAAPVGSDNFVQGRVYRGDFPDPAVLRVGNTWYAYGTTIANRNLPVLSSTDLVHWRSRGEGLAHVARWADSRRIGDRTVATTWAPTVERFGKTFVHAYATPVRGNHSPRKLCISTSTSTSPVGGFVDRRRTPLICPRTRGAIDPAFFTGVSGGRYLLWKREQMPTSPSHIFISRLSADGQSVVGPPTHLLTTQDDWERPLIENPSMIRYAGRYYLFYSGGSYADDSYATGYAVCESVTGPCTRASDQPLLATGGRVSGPGGAVAFVDRAGQLRLAYAAWDYGNTGYPKDTSCLRTAAGCPQRKLHVATLGVDPDGALKVVRRG